MRDIKDTITEAKHELKYNLDPESRWGIIISELLKEVEQCHVDLNEYALDKKYKTYIDEFKWIDL
jgi:hypothetical protein